MKAITRIDHVQPYFENRVRRITGMVAPPADDPPMQMPDARARRRWNQWLRTEIETVETMAEAIPPRMERHRMKCQYFVHSASSI